MNATARVRFRAEHPTLGYRGMEGVGSNQLDNPEVRGLVLNARDITESPAKEAELQAQREGLHQREKLAAMGSLRAGVAHELNNPLSVVVARAALLEEDLAATPASATAGKIRAAAERCARIVRTFLALAWQRPPQRETLNLNDAIQTALDMVRYSLTTSGIEVVLDLDPRLPALHGDADQIHQVLMNIFVNAQQAMADQSTPKRSTVSSRHLPTHALAEIRMTDTGPGIPESVRGRTFDAYFTSKPIGQGTGIGLAVSLSFVEAHNGTLRVETPAAGGTCFVVTLPLTAETGSAASTVPVLVAARGSGRRVPVVDDEHDLRAVLVAILARAEVLSVVRAACGD